MSPLETLAALLAGGDAASAAHMLRGIDPAALSDDDRVVAVLLAAEAGAIDWARAAIPHIVSADARARLELVLVDGAEELDAAGPVDDEPIEPRVSEAAADDETVALFLRFFGGRRDLYARQWIDERRHRTGYQPVEEPLTAAVVARHLEGRLTLGQYVLHPDASCTFGVIDLDLAPSALAELRAAHGDDVAPVKHPGLRAFAARLLDAARRLGVSLFPEDSGGKGLHLWCFFSPRRAASVVRTVLGQTLVAAGPQPPDVTVELFPKQDRPGPRGLSSLVTLPLGVHLGTMRRCRLLDDRLEPIAEPLTALRRLASVRPDVVDAIAGRRVVPLPAPELGPVPAGVPAPPTVTSARSLAEVLRGIEPGAAEKEACERVLQGCSALSRLVAKALETRHLEPDEARAVTYTLGLVGPKPALAAEVLAAAGASLRELERLGRGLPTPTGCARLKAITALTCPGCPAREHALPYPTPMLLAVGQVAPAPPRHTPFAPWVEGDVPLVQGPVDGLADLIRGLDERLARIERRDPGDHE